MIKGIIALVVDNNLLICAILSPIVTLLVELLQLPAAVTHVLPEYTAVNVSF